MFYLIRKKTNNIIFFKKCNLNKTKLTTQTVSYSKRPAPKRSASQVYCVCIRYYIQEWNERQTLKPVSLWRQFLDISIYVQYAIFFVTIIKAWWGTKQIYVLQVNTSSLEYISSENMLRPEARHYPLFAACI